MRNALQENISVEQGNPLWPLFFENDQEISKIIASQPNDVHIIFLTETLKNKDDSVLKLFSYGKDILPKETERPDESISTYYYLLSELKDLSPEMRDWAMDAMVYSENDSDFPTAKYTELQDQFSLLFK